jgi:hypothetical protein
MCPECEEPVTEDAIRPEGWALNVHEERLLSRHLDGSPLCPVSTSDGYLPALPVEAVERVDYTALGEAIDKLDFDHPFKIVDGDVVDGLSGVWAPEVYHSDTDDIEILGSGWASAVVGMTGQYSYRGAVMHPSELIGAAIAERLHGIATDAAEDGQEAVFVAVTVEVHGDEDEPAGWTVLYRI